MQGGIISRDGRSRAGAGSAFGSRRLFFAARFFIFAGTAGAFCEDRRRAGENRRRRRLHGDGRALDLCSLALAWEKEKFGKSKKFLLQDFCCCRKEEERWHSFDS